MKAAKQLLSMINEKYPAGNRSNNIFLQDDILRVSVWQNHHIFNFDLNENDLTRPAKDLFNDIIKLMPASEETTNGEAS